MAIITCDEAETLINEAASLGCRSPREQELAKLALENRIATYLATTSTPRGAYRTVETTATVQSGDYLLLCDSTGGGFTVTLPPAALVAGRMYAFVKINAGGGNVIVDGYGSETINGSATHTLNAHWNSVTIMSNGVAWFILADH